MEKSIEFLIEDCNNLKIEESLEYHGIFITAQYSNEGRCDKCFFYNTVCRTVNQETKEIKGISHCSYDGVPKIFVATLHKPDKTIFNPK